MARIAHALEEVVLGEELVDGLEGEHGLHHLHVTVVGVPRQMQVGNEDLLLRPHVLQYREQAHVVLGG